MDANDSELGTVLFKATISDDQIRIALLFELAEIETVLRCGDLAAALIRDLRNDVD